MAEVCVFQDPEELGRAVAERVVSVIRRKPLAVVGLATGSSPLHAYRAWGELARAEGLDQSGVRGFALDECVGIDPADPRSYHAVIRDEAVALSGLDPERVEVPFAATLADADGAGAAYEEAIRGAGGVDVQFLGIGRNGHLAFNEPGSPADSRTRGIELTVETRADNARFFGGIGEVPEFAITQGLGTILEARELLVIAVGAAKAEAVAAALEGPVSEDVPASLLRRRAGVTWFLDAAAAGGLTA